MQPLRIAAILVATCVPMCFPCAARAEAADAHYLGRSARAWRADLESASAQARFDALVALAAIGPDADAAVADVAKRLDDPHPQVRERAAGTLAALGPKGQAEVIAALESDDPVMRGICCDVLTWSKPPRRAAAAALRRRLRDAKPNVRYLAAFALTAVDPNSTDAIPVLQEALGERNAPAVIGASHAAARLGHRARPLLKSLLAVFAYPNEKALMAAGQALRGLDPSVTPQLAKRAAELDANPAGRIVLMGVLADLGSRKTKTARLLLPYVGDFNPAVAVAAIDTLTRIGSNAPDVVRRLESAALGELGHEAQLRPKALAALGTLKLRMSDRLVAKLRTDIGGSASPETYGPLLPAFQNGLAVATAPGDGPGTPQARARLLRALVAGATSSDAGAWRASARSAVLRAIEEGSAALRTKAADLVAPLFGEDASIVSTLMAAASKPGGASCGRVAASLLTRALEDPDPWHTAGDPARRSRDRSVWIAAGTGAIPRLRDLVGAENLEASLRARIALAYLQADDADAVAGCIEALAGPELALRRAAAACLATIEPGTDTVVNALARVIRNRNENPVVRRTAAVALARQGEGAEALIRTQVKSSRGPVRRFWLVAMGRAGSRVADLLPDVIEDLESESDAVRDAAVEAIAAMGSAAKKVGPRIAELLTKRSARRRAAAMRAFAALGKHAAPWAQAMFEAVVAEPRGDRARFAGWLADVGPGAVAVLAAEAAGGGGWERRTAAINVLARIGAPAARETVRIAQALKAPDSTVRAAACDLLGLLGPEGSASVPLLTVRLTDPVGRVRVAAARALVMQGARQTTLRAKLVQMHQSDRHAFVREAIGELIASIERKDDG